jgi:hypothetical protein
MTVASLIASTNRYRVLSLPGDHRRKSNQSCQKGRAQHRFRVQSGHLERKGAADQLALAVRVRAVGVALARGQTDRDLRGIEPPADLDACRGEKFAHQPVQTRGHDDDGGPRVDRFAPR